MKMRIELNHDSIKEIISTHLRKDGWKVKEVWLEASPQHDGMDRPTGGHVVFATATVEKPANVSSHS